MAKSALGIAMLVAASGCAGARQTAGNSQPATAERVLITRGEVITPGATITGDGFALTYGKAFDPPFRVLAAECPAKRQSGELTSRRLALQWLSRGAKRVRVSLPSTPAPLFGVLLLGAPEAAEEATTRAYRIEIPQSYVDAATNGRISAIFGLTSSTNAGCRSPATWVLWISDEPIQ